MDKAIPREGFLLIGAICPTADYTQRFNDCNKVNNEIKFNAYGFYTWILQ